MRTLVEGQCIWVGQGQVVTSIMSTCLGALRNKDLDRWTDR